MESRNISLTLEKAKEWYNSNSAELKEVALQAYTEEELKTPKFTDIKSFEDAARALGIRYTNLELVLKDYSDKSIFEHVKAVTRLDIIRKALNKDWKPSLVKDIVYYPYVRLYPADKAREAVRSKGWSLGSSFYVEGEKYTLVGGDCYSCYYGGMAVFGYRYGSVQPHMGLLGCKSREIAEHMSRYFSKEIFEAVYAHHTGTYQWV